MRIEIPCPRCQTSFQAGVLPEWAIGTMIYDVTADGAEWIAHAGNELHDLSPEEWEAADAAAYRAYRDAKGQYDGPDTSKERD